MVWRRLTLLLVASCVAICAWMYLRDRDAGGPVQSSRVEAEVDASQMLDMVSSSRSCEGRCSAAVLGQTASGRWRIRLSAPTWQRCFDLDVQTFDYTSARGLSGIRSAACGRVGAQKTLGAA